MAPQQERLAQALGAILRSQRAWHHYTQEDMAAATGIHRTRVGRFERGCLFLDVWEAAQLAMALHMPLEVLLQPCLELVHTGTLCLQDGTCDRAAAPDIPMRYPPHMAAHAIRTSETAYGTHGSDMAILHD
jgi:DNA-binding XRE family transcriptional regulator